MPLIYFDVIESDNSVIAVRDTDVVIPNGSKWARVVVSTNNDFTSVWILIDGMLYAFIDGVHIVPCERSFLIVPNPLYGSLYDEGVEVEKAVVSFHSAYPEFTAKLVKI